MMALRFMPFRSGAGVAFLRRGGAASPPSVLGVKRALQWQASTFGASLAASAAPAALHLSAACCGSDPAGLPAPTPPAAAATSPPELEPLDIDLPFVNRYAEALDVLVPNLRNHHALHAGQRIKYVAPLAAQPPGTGKTALGEHITAILRRPRDDTTAEAAIAKRMAGAWCWQGQAPAALARALQDPRDENLVMRTLLAMSNPVHHETLLALKDTQPLIIEMKGLVEPDFGWSFSKALAYAIFCAARGLRGTRPATKAAFLTQDSTLQTASGIVEELIEERGAPLMLVLDDITDLAHPAFAKYFEGVARDSPLHRAMASLSLTLQLLHAIPRCFVYCTGRSLWLTSRALIGSGSPLNVQPTLLQPLTPADVLQALRVPVEPDGRALLDSLGVALHLAEPLAERAVALTGGVGRALQFLLRARQWSAANGAPTIASADELGPAFELLLPRLANLPGNMLRIEWDGPRAVAAGDLPQSVLQQGEQQRLLQLLARTLLLDATFHPEHTVMVGGFGVRLSDVAATFGLSYSPAEAPQGVNDAPAEDSAAKGRTELKLVAGEWLCRSLVHVVSGDPAALASAQLLATMRDFGGTMRGRPFEMLCADALCYRSLLTPDQPLVKLLPHLGRSMRGKDTVPRLSVVALPKADKRTKCLSADEKATLLQSRQRWTGKYTIHAADLPWMLAEWLPSGCLGVPADAQSGSQDLFLRLSGGVVGFALKAASAAAGTAWADLRDELSKMPDLTAAGLPYTLVLWSLHLSTQLSEAVGGADADVFTPGTWVFHEGKLKLRPKKDGTEDGTEDGQEVFTIAPGTELVVVNPLARSGGGMRELLGNALFDALQGMGVGANGLSISHLTDWMVRAQ